MLTVLMRNADEVISQAAQDALDHPSSRNSCRLGEGQKLRATR